MQCNNVFAVDINGIFWFFTFLFMTYCCTMASFMQLKVCNSFYDGRSITEMRNSSSWTLFWNRSLFATFLLLSPPRHARVCCDDVCASYVLTIESGMKNESLPVLRVFSKASLRTSRGHHARTRKLKQEQGIQESQISNLRFFAKLGKMAIEIFKIPWTWRY